MSKIILGFSGLMVSGKDTCKTYVMEKYGASGHRYSTMLRDILNRLYLPITRENMQDLSLDLRTRFGSDTLARVIAEDVKNDNNEIIIVEGIRRLPDIVSLKDLPNFYLISLNVDLPVRYQRLTNRRENADDATKTFEEFVTDNGREAEQDIPTVMAKAKYQLNNNGTKEELYAQIDKIIADIKKST
ncbi:MAG: AAA family ATPase [Patescibacteria group bacterium]|jgi:dephospho-CoA kinase